jgi:uncharacterized SAM-binding protein YcdF (DUF218 family)
MCATEKPGCYGNVGRLLSPRWLVARRNAWTGRWRVGASIVVLLFVLIVLLAAWTERPTIFGWIARHWAISDHLEVADAVAILGGGVDTRPAAAVRLFESGLAKQILISATAPSPMGGSDLNVFERDILLRDGVPASAITEFGNNSVNTYEEARALAHWAEQNHAQRIIVPTEIFPSRRVRWIVRRELAKVGVHVMIEAVPAPSYSFDDWWQRRDGFADFRREIIKYLYYRTRY